MRIPSLARELLVPASFAVFASCGGDSPTTTQTPEQKAPEAAKATSLAVSPDSVVVGTWGDTTRVTATVKDQNGNAMSGVSVVWSSSDTAVAKVDASGLVTSMKPGQATISAAVSSLTAESRAIVKLQMNAKCKAPTGTPARGPVGGTPTFERAPNGTFQVRSPRYGVNEIAAGDFDGDGDEDLLVLSYNFPPAEPGGEVLFWRNVGGRFEDASADVIGGTEIVAENPRQIEIADLNGDGVLDVFAAQHGYDADPFDGAPDLVFLSQPGGKLREVSATNMRPNEKNSYTHASASGDIDCDGDVDLFTGSGGGRHGVQTHHLYVNSGVGSFTAEDTRMPAWIKPPQLRFTAAVMCDFDRDGDPDLYLGGEGNNKDVFLVNDGFGRFREIPPELRLRNRYGESGHTVDLRCADVNLDGWPDLIHTSGNSSYGSMQTGRGAFDIWLNRGDMRFENVTETWAPGNEVTQDWIFRAVPVDFNADGWPDIYAKSRHDKQTLFINQGGTGFAPVPGPDKHLYWVDANGDERTDLFWEGGTGPNGEQWSPYLYFTR